MSLGKGFLTGLGFLSRLGPADEVSSRELGLSLVFFPAIGLVLGMILALPFAYGFLPGHYWVQAWILVGGSLWLTRGLHFDGWCDIWDAWGSGAKGEAFFTVMKDSRAGAFGVVAICMAVFGQLFLFREVLGERAYHVVPWALLLGRATAAVLAVAARDLRRPGLGGQFLAHARPWINAPVLLQVGLVGAVFVMPAALVLGLALALLGMVELYRLAKKNGALNGDFLGAAVIWGELSALLGWSLTGAQSLPGILEWWHLI